MSGLLLREIAAHAFDGEVLTPAHPDYERYRRVWNGMADRRPAAIVRARSVEDVRRSVHAAATSGVLLAVRGGGHSIPGLSTCDDGLVIDLGLLNEIRIDRDARTVDIGGGALLGDLDRALLPLGHVVPAGVISHTGVGGLTLGGGMGWSSRKYGLTIDSLLGAEIVTAGGEIVWVDAQSDPELFWGIRGGGGNFGVVTRFRFRFHDFGPVVLGRWSYDLQAAPKALPKLREFARAAPRDMTLNLTLAGNALSINVLWFGDAAMADEMLAPFGQLAGPGAGDGIAPISFLEFQTRNDEFFAWLRRYYVKGGFWRDISDDVITHMLRQAASAPTPDCEISAILLGGAVTDVAEDATAYSGRDAGYYWLVEPVWDDPADDRACLAWGREAARGLKDPTMQGNYVNEQGDTGFDIAVDAYGAEKYRRLTHLKRRMDPFNLFRLNQNIKPAG